ncbi:MAG: choice-of-anchor D domain-containing protein, partial [Candidatus Kapabacteria bacterium]|nr:choice-of-anchor D domain-containing protein [Candidatus Kapabacteria bacterium]
AGSTIPSTTNNTDFGALSVVSQANSYTINNTGTATLNISSITSSNSGEFVVSGAPTTVAAGGSATFTVTFTPSANGDRTATVTINSDDCTNPAFSFAVKGGKQASALAFDGVDDNIIIPTPFNLPLGNTSRTLEAYVLTPSAFTNSRIVGYGQTSNGAQFHMGILNSKLFFWGHNADAISNTTLSPNTWYHFAVTYDGTNIRLYINGVLDNTTPLSLSTATSPVTMGGSSSLFFWAGGMNATVDEVRIWNTARSCDEIAGYRNCELAGNESGLVAYYKFNQGVANGTNSVTTTLTNAVSGGTNGTLTNFNLTNGNTTSNWTSPGGVTTGTSCPASITAPEINVTGNSNNIADGQTTPGTTNGTDFGTCVISKTYTIQNTGNTTLTISGITTSNTTDFSIASGYPTSIAATSSGTFTVNFTPTTTGTKSSTIIVTNNDCDEASYDFAIQASSTLTVGTYSATTVQAGKNTTVTPSAAPTGCITSMVVYTNTNFDGLLTADPATGVVRITDALPAGTYTVTVKAFGIGTVSTTTTFALTVSNPDCSQGGTSSITSISLNPGITSTYGVALGDFNNDGKQDIVASNQGSNTV